MSTIGVNFKLKELLIGRSYVKMILWDTAGQERFRNLSKSYYHGAQGIAIIYDVTNKQSFITIANWIEEVSLNAPENIYKVLIANKIDMTNLRVVTEAEGIQMANHYNISYFETSAKSDEGVTEAFDFLAINIVGLLSVTPSYLDHSRSSIVLRARSKELPKKKCCN